MGKKKAPVRPVKKFSENNVIVKSRVVESVTTQKKNTDHLIKDDILTIGNNIEKDIRASEMSTGTS